MGLAELLFGICRNGSRLEMYDVNFGGTKHMTKRLTIALVAVALFVLMAVMPVSALSNGTVINQSAIVFIGEQGLNVTHALNQAVGPAAPIDGTPAQTTIGWWASAAAINTSAPTKTIDLSGSPARYLSLTVAPSDFVGYTGNWYSMMDGTRTSGIAFSVADPSLAIAVWDFQQASDVTGKSVPQGEHLGFKIDTNMYSAIDGTKRSNIITWNPTWTNWTGITLPPTTPAWAWSNVTYPAGVGNGTVVTTTTLTYPNTYNGVNTYNVYRVFNDSTATWAVSPVIGKTGQWTIAGIVGTDAFVAPFLTPTAATDGYITLKVKDANGATYSLLQVGDPKGTPAIPDVATPITGIFVNTQPYFFGSATGYWVTDAVDFNNQYLYPVGTYTAWAESTLNKMKDNYKNAGADYTGKTVSGAGTITLVSDSVKIEANKDSVVRSKSFSITVTGKPSTQYYVWVKGTSTMDGSYDNQPPMININQEKVYFDTTNVPITQDGQNALGIGYPIGSYAFENGGGTTAGPIHKAGSTDGSIRGDVAKSVAPLGTNAGTVAISQDSTRYYALINTTTSGTRTVEFVTNNWTKAQKYTIRVEQNFPVYASTGYGSPYQASNSSVKSDEVDVKVEKGAVTIVAAGDQSYYLGEEIKFSGTNTESYKTYLFIVGPNLKAVGSQIQNSNPRNIAVIDNDASSFKQVDVNGDNTWSWKWGTSTVALDAGTYTIYAVSQPRDASNLQSAAFGTVSIIIKKPFVSATASQSTVAQGDKIFITGTAEGNPSGVMIWILGKNYPTNFAGVVTESVNSDASFKHEVTQTQTKTMYPGQYFVVVQHPMQNNKFDIVPQLQSDGSTVNVVNLQLNAVGSTTNSGTKVFTLLGASSLQGSDAAEALVQGINDPNVDDTYTKLQFLVEVPVIRIDPVGDKHVGDKFTITAATNLAVDDDILVQVYSSSFKPTQKSQSGEFSGATGTVKVTKGDSGMNKISFDVDSSTFKPDEYIITADAILQTATGTALFNVLDGTAPTAVPTVVVTTAAPVTAVPTTVATAVPTAIPTTKSPGYGALIALIGLGAVAFIVVRRH
jgi:PGF-CTERM protein